MVRGQRGELLRGEKKHVETISRLAAHQKTWNAVEIPCSTAAKAWSTHAAVAHCRVQLRGSAVLPCGARRGDVLVPHCHASGPRSDVAERHGHADCAT